MTTQRGLWAARALWRATLWLVQQPQPAPAPEREAERERESRQLGRRIGGTRTAARHAHARNYQVAVPDANAFYCFGGRLRVLSGWWVPLATVAMIVAPAIVFWTTTASLVWHRVHPVLVVVLAYTWLMAAMNFVWAAFTDPGTLPRNLHLPTRVDAQGVLAHLPPEYSSAVLLPHHSTRPVTVRFCAVCQVWRPPRAAHCYLCNACCLLHDHHCVFMANCVGARNYRYFLWFLAWVVCTGLLMGLASLACLFCGPRPFAHELRAHPAPLVVACYTMAAIMYPLALLLLHLFLTLHNYTMREFLTSVFRAKHHHVNAYDLHSVWKNWYYYWIGRVRPSLTIRGRTMYSGGDVRYIKVVIPEEQGGKD